MDSDHDGGDTLFKNIFFVYYRLKFNTITEKVDQGNN